jgi:hypothetical protein
MATTTPLSRTSMDLTSRKERPLEASPNSPARALRRLFLARRTRDASRIPVSIAVISLLLLSPLACRRNEKTPPSGNSGASPISGGRAGLYGLKGPSERARPSKPTEQDIPDWLKKKGQAGNPQEHATREGTFLNPSFGLYYLVPMDRGAFPNLYYAVAAQTG